MAVPASPAVQQSSGPADLRQLNLGVIEHTWVGSRMHQPKLVAQTADGVSMCEPVFMQPSLLNLKLYTALKISEAGDRGVKLGVDMFLEANERMSWFQSMDHCPCFLVFIRGLKLHIMKVVGEMSALNGRRIYTTTPAQVKNHPQRDWTDGQSFVTLTLEKTYYMQQFVFHGDREDPQILAFHIETVTGKHRLHLFKVSVAPACVQEAVELELSRSH